MDADQEGDQAQHGLAVPCLVIFAATYVVGVFLSCFLVQKEYQLDLSSAFVWGLMIPLVFTPMMVLGYFLYNIVTMLLGTSLLVGFFHLVTRLCFEKKRRLLLLVAFIVAGIWLFAVAFVAINLKDGF
jgi:hypothetical protein